MSTSYVGSKHIIIAVINMPIDINLDRRLRVTWCKYQIILSDMNKSYNKKKFIAEAKCDSRWDAEQLFAEEIRQIEKQRRTELDTIKKQVKIENAERLQMQKAYDDQIKTEKSAQREKRREQLELSKKDTPLLRTSARFRKNANGYHRGSMWV